MVGKTVYNLFLGSKKRSILTTGELTDPNGNVCTQHSIQNSSLSLDKLVITTICFVELGNPVFKVHITSQIKFNANGEPTATVDNEVIECY